MWLSRKLRRTCPSHAWSRTHSRRPPCRNRASMHPRRSTSSPECSGSRNPTSNRHGRSRKRTSNNRGRNRRCMSNSRGPSRNRSLISSSQDRSPNRRHTSNSRGPSRNRSPISSSRDRSRSPTSRSTRKPKVTRIVTKAESNRTRGQPGKKPTAPRNGLFSFRACPVRTRRFAPRSAMSDRHRPVGAMTDSGPEELAKHVKTRPQKCYTSDALGQVESLTKRGRARRGAPPYAG